MSNLVFDESSANREASHGYAWWFSGDTFEKATAEERTRRKRSFIHHLTSHPGRLTIIYFLLLVALSTSLLLLVSSCRSPHTKRSRPASPPRSSPPCPHCRHAASPS